VSIEQKIDFVQELDESIREKSIQYFSDSKLSRLNSGHPLRLPKKPKDHCVAILTFRFVKALT
jgi:hypothetical protein